MNVVGGHRRDRRMPQLATDDVQPHAGCEREFRVGMPRAVQPDRRDTGLRDVLRRLSPRLASTSATC